ncbi:MAG: hypothetical protein P8N49_02595 [Opitutales bacterium]|nr:hypothetical protein [Opitutales bacterium]
MEGLLYIIIKTPNSGVENILSLGLNKDQENQVSLCLLPGSEPSSNLPFLTWCMQGEEIQIENPKQLVAHEWFLFLSNELDLADQIEASLALLNKNPQLNLCRILSFIDSHLIGPDNFTSWIDGAAHFSDAICFSNRTNKNGALVSQLIEKYKTMRYPMETYILSAKKEPPINQILAHTPRRISHVFDPTELLEEEDTPKQDSFLERQANGKRNRSISKLFS